MSCPSISQAESAWRVVFIQTFGDSVKRSPDRDDDGGSIPEGNASALSIGPDNARTVRFAIYRQKDKDWMPEAGNPFNNATWDRFAKDQAALNEGLQVVQEHAIESLVGFPNKRRRE
ncbi:hypothetical protein [Xanthomonas dyei]|uniref:hypothetical protein n=1 Tax=Xanthomonas dyei TaxID=743699 RepID=UPI001EE8DC4B|nr:hypothetical protein [Xanthomonas dyei]